MYFVQPYFLQLLTRIHSEIKIFSIKLIKFIKLHINDKKIIRFISNIIIFLLTRHVLFDYNKKKGGVFMILNIKVCDVQGNIRLESSADNQVTLVYPEVYQKGDSVELKVETPGYYEVRFEDTMNTTIVYLDGTKAKFVIPFDAERYAYCPRSFEGPLHLITAAVANLDFVYARRNLALNPFDAHGATGMYPHAVANVETRNEALFAARNAIDGIHANHSHYPYPFQSWGINQDPKAQLKVEFGASVNLDSIVLTLRADFPHDNYWVKATVEFSDGSLETVSLVKTEIPQEFKITKNNITWLMLKELISSDDPSPFPALTQIEAWGKLSAEK